MKEYVLKLKPGPMHIQGGILQEGRGYYAKIKTDNPTKLWDNPHVEAVEENTVLELPDTQDFNETITAQDLKDQEETWGQIQMWIANGRSNSTKRKVKLAVLDTGIDSDHPDLPTPTRARSFVSDEVTAEDYLGHGTHVAGTIAALKNDRGVIGMMPDVELYICKIFQKEGGAQLFDIVSALDWCKRNGIDIINASWGGGSNSNLMKQAISSTNALFVNAAGNSGKNLDDENVYPASYGLPNMLVVAAVDWVMMNPWWTNYGVNSVDFVAPGDKILSTTNDGQYARKSGTSMACPHIAGAAALMWQGDWKSTKEWMLQQGLGHFWLESPFFTFGKEVPDPSLGQDPNR